LAFAVADDVEFGGNYSYDDAFHSRASADLTIRFGGGSHMEKLKEQAKAEEQPQIKELSETPSNRDVRVHDRVYFEGTMAPAILFQSLGGGGGFVVSAPPS
jgi:hypothetical protein